MQATPDRETIRAQSKFTIVRSGQYDRIELARYNS